MNDQDAPCCVQGLVIIFEGIYYFVAILWILNHMR